MDRDTIFRLARDAAFHTPVMEGELLRFASLVAAHEREECAKVCDETVAHHYIKQLIPAKDEAMLLAACADCAAAIRSRK